MPAPGTEDGLSSLNDPFDAQEVSFTFNAQDAKALVAFVNLDWNRRRFWLMRVAAVTALLIFFGAFVPFLQRRPIQPSDWQLAGLSVLAGMACGEFVQWLQMRRSARHVLASHGGPHRVAMSAGELMVDFPRARSSRTWSSVREVREGRGFLFLVVSPRGRIFQATCVPARAFRDPAHYETFRDAAVHYWQAAQAPSA